MARLTGKRCLITGGTTGIGLATARLFLAEGARVIITGKNPDTLARAQAELGPEVTAFRSDSASADDQRNLAALVEDHYGKLDVTFLNAGHLHLAADRGVD
jgi:NAD(P)-dependent dehydrogenase (short-subunit alcohol dehydrogenase family)